MVHQFAGNTNLLCTRSCFKKLNELVNADLNQLVSWINAKKCHSILKKTEMVIFKSKQNKFDGDLKIKLCGERQYTAESVKYLEVKIDANLNSKYFVNDLSIKLNRANAVLFKIRKYVSLKNIKIHEVTATGLKPRTT